MRPHAWVRRAALLLFFVVGLASFASPARGHARAHGAYVISTTAAARLVALRAGEPDGARQPTREVASPALPPSETPSIAPAAAERLQRDPAAPDSTHELPSPAPNARGPPPSA